MGDEECPLARLPGLLHWQAGSLPLAPSGMLLVSGEQQNDSVIFFRFLPISYCKILTIVPCAIQ